MARKTARRAAIKSARSHLEQARIEMNNLADRIDHIGELAVDVAGDEYLDSLACYASNALQGSLALLREIEAMVEGPAKTQRTRRKP